MLFDILFNIIDFTKGAFWMALVIGFILLPFYLIIIIESFWATLFCIPCWAISYSIWMNMP